MQLTDPQRKAIEHAGRNLQLIACAGSGKTEVVARRVVHLLTPGREGTRFCMIVNIPKPVREYRFVANLREDDLPAFREALVDLADGFTEIGTNQGTRCIVGLRGRGARQRLQRLLAEWEPRARQGKIDLEDCSTAADRDEIYFLLPLQRNPDPAGGPRRPLFTNEQLAGFRDELAQRFRFRPEMVRVYGEWRNDAGQLIPDYSLLIRVPRRGRGSLPALRRFIRREVLATQGCDQHYVHLSSRWLGEFVPGV